MDAARGGPRHPVALAAAGAMLLNDLVLRQVVPGWWTGKISDAGFVIVAPVALAYVFSVCGWQGRRSRETALLSATAFYVVLQLWPPLGHFFSAAHVADVEDLIVLPFAALAVVAWRGSRREASAFAMVPLAGALVATYMVPEPAEVSWPCGNSGMPWETAEPLRLDLYSGAAPEDHQASDFLQGLSLVGPDGPVELVYATHVDDVAICAKAGLQPSTEYTWTIGPWDRYRSNSQGYSHDALPTVVFTTTTAEGAPAADGAACAALATAVVIDAEYACGNGDTGMVM